MNGRTVLVVMVVSGEQPPSSMTPAILESKSGGLLVIGGAGGSMITGAVALVLLKYKNVVLDSCFLLTRFICVPPKQSVINHLWLGMSLKEAIDAPIVYVDSKNNVNFPAGFDQVIY